LEITLNVTDQDAIQLPLNPIKRHHLFDKSVLLRLDLRSDGPFSRSMNLQWSRQHQDADWN
jgi:hypothetical protein